MAQTKKTFRSGVLMLTGSIIGAGFFTLARAGYNAGLVPTVIIMLAVGVIVMMLHLLLAELNLSLPGHKTFVGMARAILPKRLAKTVTATVIAQFFIGILAYTILGGGFLQVILHGIGIHRNIVRSVFLYTALIGGSVWRSLTIVNSRNNIIVILLLVTIATVICAGIVGGQETIMIPAKWINSIGVYGVTLFALSSINAIPMLNEVTGNNFDRIRHVILTAGGITTVCSIAFALATISISGTNTSSDSVIGLYRAGGVFLGYVACIAGIAAIITSHIPTAEHLKEIFMRDQGWSKTLSRLFIVVAPLLVYLYFDPSIIRVMSIGGSLLGGLLIIFVALMNIYLHKTKQKITIKPMIPHDMFWSWVLIIVCSVGVLYQIVTLYK